MSGEAWIWGWDAAKGFADGLEAAKSLVRTAATAIASSMRSILHFSVPDEGPLADADEYGPDFAMLIADGLRSKIAEVRSAATDVAKAAKDELAGSLSGDLTARGGLNLVAGQGKTLPSKTGFLANAFDVVPGSLLSSANTPVSAPYVIQLAGDRGLGSGKPDERTITNNYYQVGDIDYTGNEQVESAILNLFDALGRRANT